MQIKNRIILFLFFTLHALIALVTPRPGIEILTDHNEAEKKRKAQARAAGTVRVGDRA